MTPQPPIGDRVLSLEIQVSNLKDDVSEIEDRLDASNDRSMQLRVAIVGLIATTIAAVIGLVSAILLSGAHA